MTRRARWWLVLLGCAIAAAVLVANGLGESEAIARTVVEWLADLGRLGPFAFVSVYFIATIALFPAWILTVAAGIIFGVTRGTLYVLIGAVTGAGAAFLIARYLARPLVARRVRQDGRFARIDRAVGRDGLRVVFLMRLSPVVPYNLLNYGLGLTAVRFRDYLLASVGMVPGTLLYVYSGKAIGDVTALARGAAVDHGAGYYVVLGLGLAATIALTVLLTRIARNALREENVDVAPAA